MCYGGAMCGDMEEGDGTRVRSKEGEAGGPVGVGEEAAGRAARAGPRSGRGAGDDRGMVAKHFRL